MKRIAILGLLILPLLFLLATCGGAGGPLGSTGDDNVAYTNVEYSKDMSEVTIMLDGTTPFRSVKGAQRAMSKDIALLSADFFEVVFVAGPTATIGVARASWEIGQSAGISGVNRGAAAGINYSFTATKATGVAGPTLVAATDGIAILLAGKNSNKTLLGVGVLTEVDGETSGTAATTITPDTKKVKFGLKAIRAGLCVAGETAGDAGMPQFSSFTFTESGPTDWTGLTAANSLRAPLGSRNLPVYSIKKDDGMTTPASYTFGGGAALSTVTASGSVVPGYGETLRFAAAVTTANNIVQFTPRYLDNNRYLEPKFILDTASKVALAGTYTGTAGAEFINVIPLVFTTGVNSEGKAFEFFIQIPVYGLTTKASSNGGGDAETWWIRSGLGTEQYSIDDGFSTGGAVLIGVGTKSIDWINIEWTWVN